MKSKPSVVVAEVDKDYIYVSDSPVGEIVSNFKHPTDIKFLSNMADEIKTLKNERARDNAVLESTLKALGVETKNSYTPMYLLCQTLLNAKLVLDGQIAYGYEIDSMTGYVKRLAKLDGVTTELPEFPQFMHLVDGVLTFDEEKYNAMMSAS